MSHLILSSSNWWEPGTSGIFDVGDLAAFFGLLIAGSTVVFGVTRWWMKLMRKMMVEEIGRATTQIQPTANGGLSLPDVARKTDALEKKVNEMHKDQLETKELLIKVLASAVIIPDTPPIQEPKARNRSKKTSQ